MELFWLLVLICPVLVTLCGLVRVLSRPSLFTSFEIDVTSNDSPHRMRWLIAHSAFNRLRNASYFPTPWLFSGHLQTIFSAKGCHWSPVITYHREILNVDAYQPHLFHGTVALDWAVSPKMPSPSTPTVVILHGLTGGSTESYVRRIVDTLHRQCEWRVVVMNARGCGNTQLKSAQAYCAAYTDDIRQAVRAIKARLPHAPLMAVGFSLGSNILVKYIGEEGERIPLVGAVSVANPFDLQESSRQLHAGIHRIVYAKGLAGNLVRLFRKHEAHFRTDDRIDMDHVLTSTSVREFDQRLTAKTFGYPTVDHYYADASCNRFIPNVRCPLLCLNALDDPISSYRSIPYQEIRDNPYVVLLTTPTGGHSMDWFQGLFRPTAWSPPIVASFLTAAAATHGISSTRQTAMTHSSVLLPHVHMNGHGSGNHDTSLSLVGAEIEDNSHLDAPKSSGSVFESGQKQPVEEHAGVSSAPDNSEMQSVTTEQAAELAEAQAMSRRLAEAEELLKSLDRSFDSEQPPNLDRLATLLDSATLPLRSASKSPGKQLANLVRRTVVAQTRECDSLDQSRETLVAASDEAAGLVQLLRAMSSSERATTS